MSEKKGDITEQEYEEMADPRMVRLIESLLKLEEWWG